MEYTYVSGQKRIRVQLQDDALILHGQDQPVTIPYAQLSEVSLSRSGNLYQVRLKARGHNAITIKSDGTEDEGGMGRTFALFIRVLHHHLHRRSDMHFRCFPDCRLLVVSILVISQALLAILWIGPLSSWGWLDRLWLTCATLALAGVLALILPKFLSRTYSPLNIPLQYLP